MLTKQNLAFVCQVSSLARSLVCLFVCTLQFSWLRELANDLESEITQLANSMEGRRFKTFRNDSQCDQCRNQALVEEGVSE